VIRYLSNILTDHEKQKAFTLFLGEFQPNPQFPGKNLWDEDVELQYRAPPGDVSVEKLTLYPLITRRQKLLQFNNKIYDVTNAFSDESIKIIAEEESVVTGRSEKKGEKNKHKMKQLKTAETQMIASQCNLVNPPIDKRTFLPSHYNYIDRFKQLEAEVEKNFFSFLDS